MHAQQTAATAIFPINRLPSPLVLVKRDIPFPREVLNESKVIELAGALLDGRRSVKGATIDHSSSPDLDDAIWATALANGRYKIDVTIADVTAVIGKGSVTDAEAFLRGATIYRNKTPLYPMMPRRLSENLLSLCEGAPKPTITISTTLNSGLEIEKIKIERTAFLNPMRYSYAQVDAAIDEKGHELGRMFRLSFSLAERLLAKRQKEGALAFYSGKGGIVTTEDGTIINLALNPHRNSRASLIVQEFMILASRSAASVLIESGVPALFRNHKAKPPEPDMEIILNELDKLSDSPTPLEIKMMRQKLDGMFERAYYAPEAHGHFALGLRFPQAYTHVTSPLRRYPDMVNHRQLMAVIYGGSVMTREELEAISQHINSREREVRDETNTILKIERYTTAQRALETNSPSALVNGDFSRLIKLATRNGGMTEEIGKEIVKRLKAKKLNEIDLFTILFEPKAEPQMWHEIKDMALDFLKHNPGMATYLYGIASQAFNWPKIDFETKISVSAKVALGEHEFSSQVVDKSGRKGTRHRAVVDLLTQIVRTD
ncbi:MAG: RNB domain-containing ribonuclease [Candidatus Micrarchaeota archaeon]|nr:RNB domain-containing ribonuclease [Candidatus Micrarchaeota archaeon]